MDDLNRIICRQLQKEKIDSDVEVDDFENRSIEVVYFYDELDYYADKCLFDDCSDSEKIRLLCSFCSSSCSGLFSWQVCCELSKLLAKYGKLIGKKAEKFIFSDKSNHFRKASLHLSYLSTDAKWERLCIECMDLCEEDFRDGLFLACYRLNTFEIFKELVKHFTQWIEKDSDWGKGTGENLALGRFIKKWNSIPGYNLHYELQQFLA